MAKCGRIRFTGTVEGRIMGRPYRVTVLGRWLCQRIERRPWTRLKEWVLAASKVSAVAEEGLLSNSRSEVKV